jgi:hypothetical protein
MNCFENARPIAIPQLAPQLSMLPWEKQDNGLSVWSPTSLFEFGDFMPPHFESSKILDCCPMSIASEWDYGDGNEGGPVGFTLHDEKRKTETLLSRELDLLLPLSQSLEDVTSLFPNESELLRLDRVSSSEAHARTNSIASEVLHSTMNMPTERARFGTFAQTRIPMDMSSDQGDEESVTENGFPAWTILDDDSENQNTLVQEEETLMQQLLMRPVLNAFLMDTGFMDWLEMDSMEILDREKQSCLLKDVDDDGWKMMPSA